MNPIELDPEKLDSLDLLPLLEFDDEFEQTEILGLVLKPDSEFPGLLTERV